MMPSPPSWISTRITACPNSVKSMPVRLTISPVTQVALVEVNREQAARDVAAMGLRSLGNARARPQDALLPLVGSPLAERVQTGTIEVWFYQR